MHYVLNQECLQKVLVKIGNIVGYDWIIRGQFQKSLLNIEGSILLKLYLSRPLVGSTKMPY